MSFTKALRHIPNKDSSPNSSWPLVMTSARFPSGCGYFVWAVWPLAFATADCMDNLALASKYQNNYWKNEGQIGSKKIDGQNLQIKKWIYNFVDMWPCRCSMYSVLQVCQCRGVWFQLLLSDSNPWGVDHYNLKKGILTLSLLALQQGNYFSAKFRKSKTLSNKGNVKSGVMCLHPLHYSTLLIFNYR